MIQRHELGDETTHRRADHVRGRDPERIQQTNRVVGHIFERIPRVHAGREARVPVVETDDQEAATGEQGAEVVVPAEHLGAEPGDQQHRRRLRVAEGLVLDLDPVGCGSGHRGHAPQRSVTRSLAARSEVDERFTWDAESVFPDHSGWELAVDTILSSLPDLEEFKGRLGDSPETLADWFEANERAHRLMAKVMVYSTMYYSVDVADQDAAARADRARSVGAQLGAATSFALPEMLAIGIPKLREWVATSPRLAHLGHYFDRLEKLQKRIRSAEVEELLTSVSDPLATALSVHSVLANTDLKFAPAVGSDGELHEVAQGTVAALLTSPDREVRRTAFESYADQHLANRHAMAASLAGGVKRDVFFARARGYASSLEAALEPAHIPTEVFHNVVRTFRDNVATWHRYWRIRREVLGLEVLKPYDTRAQMSPNVLKVPYEQAVEWIAEGVAPLGAEYVRVLRQGALVDRWVDIYPNKGKRMGAFSTGSMDTRPFIFMSYNDDIYSMSTLAHELGHSMHSHYTRGPQPYVYSHYRLFLPELAANKPQGRPPR